MFAKKLGLKHYPAEAEVGDAIEYGLERMLPLRIDIGRLSGKHVRER